MKETVCASLAKVRDRMWPAGHINKPNKHWWTRAISWSWRSKSEPRKTGESVFVTPFLFLYTVFSGGIFLFAFCCWFVPCNGVVRLLGARQFNDLLICITKYQHYLASSLHNLYCSRLHFMNNKTELNRRFPSKFSYSMSTLTFILVNNQTTITVIYFISPGSTYQ